MRIIGVAPPETTAGSSGDEHEFGTIGRLLATECLDELLLTTNTHPDLTSLTSTPDILLIHDARLDLATPRTIRAVIDVVRTGTAEAAIATRPVTDTIKLLEPDGTLRGGWERHRLRELRSPLCCRPKLLTECGTVPDVTELPTGRVHLVDDGPPEQSS